MFNNINKYVKEIKKVNVESFSEELLKKLYSYLNSKNNVTKINKNELFIKCDDGSELKIILEKNGILYQIKESDKTLIGKYSKYKDGYYVKSNDITSTIYDLENSVSNNIINEETFKLYDKNGFEQFRRTTIKVDNYYEDKVTGDIILHKPDIMENYTENSYMYRADGRYILERKVKKYIYPDGTPAFIDIKNSDDCLIRYDLIDENTKELPNWGQFYGIDKEVFLNYFQKKSTINDVIENFYSKKYCIPDIMTL